MMKKVLFVLICIFSVTLIFGTPINIEAKTLREMKEELAETKANKAETEAKRKAAQAKINKYNNDIIAAGNDIQKCEEDIESSRQEIDELEEEIVEKNIEIEELLRFMQITGGENAYLEYIFGANDFADFIYRASVVDQLSKYNDELIDEMYVMIEENKVLQKELAEKIIENEQEIKNFQKKLLSLNVTVDDLDDERQDLNDEIKIAEEEIKFYESYGCKLDEDVSKCMDIPYSNGFIRPLVSAYVSSNYGYRYIYGKTSFHRGIDLATPEWSKVYSAAAGQVYVASTVQKGKKRCGGNIVYIKHNIGGKKYTSVYMHLIRIDVKAGDFVSAGTIIGYSGGGKGTQSWETCSTGAHLHFGIFNGWTTSGSASLDPRKFVNFPAKGKRFYSRW